MFMLTKQMKEHTSEGDCVITRVLNAALNVVVLGDPLTSYCTSLCRYIIPVCSLVFIFSLPSSLESLNPFYLLGFFRLFLYVVINLNYVINLEFPAYFSAVPYFRSFFVCV